MILNTPDGTKIYFRYRVKKIYDKNGLVRNDEDTLPFYTDREFDYYE